MKFYLDITLLPDVETNLGFLWEKVFQQVHLALAQQSYESEEIIKDRQVKLKKSKVGVAFPKFHQKHHYLGNKLRLLAMAESDIQALNLDQYFSRLEDYVHKTRIKPVPTNKINGYAFFKRVSVKGNAERLARRRKKRLETKGEVISDEDALNYFLHDNNRKPSDNTLTQMPFIYLNSETTKQRFPLFIEMKTTEQVSGKTEFSCYGLSATCSVPMF